jgi:hypothetical protein
LAASRSRQGDKLPVFLCRISSSRLSLNRSMAQPGAFRPLGLVLPDAFSVRDGSVSVFGLVWWICRHVTYLIMITQNLFVLLRYINLFVTYGLSQYNLP